MCIYTYTYTSHGYKLWLLGKLRSFLCLSLFLNFRNFSLVITKTKTPIKLDEIQETYVEANSSS